MRRYGALVVMAIALLELVGHFFFSRRAPSFEQYAELSRPIAAMRKSGDLVLIAPRWAEPMIRKALGSSLLLRDLARPDETAYEAAIEVSVTGQRAPELAGWKLLGERSVGPFVVRRLENPAHKRSVTDFVDVLGPAVSVKLAGRPCHWTERAPLSSGGLGGHPTFPRRRFRCGGSPFFNVSVTVIADQDFRPRRCLWAHPPASGELIIDYPPVQLGERIVGHGGLYWIIERKRTGAPIEMSVSVGGKDVGRYVHADGDGWSRFDFALGEHAGTRAAVRFAIRSPDHRHRHFCFEARSQ